MHIGPDDTFWVVTDPTRESELADICFVTSLRSLERQFRGGLTAAENPTIFTEKAEAEEEARRRLLSVRVARAIAFSVPNDAAENATRVALLNSEGRVVFESGIE